MVEKTLEVLHEEGLHTRPANTFVKTVKRFRSKVHLVKGEKTASGESLLKIMKLGIVRGDEVTLTCDGPDEIQAMDALISLVRPEGNDR